MLTQRTGGTVQRTGSAAQRGLAGGDVPWSSPVDVGASRAALLIIDEHDVEASAEGDTHPLAARVASPVPPLAVLTPAPAHHETSGSWPLWKLALGVVVAMFLLGVGIGVGMSVSRWMGPQARSSLLERDAEVFVPTKASVEAANAYNTALNSYFGLSGPVDKVGATMWFHKAAVEGHSGAQYYLGKCLQSGDGVIEDKVQATVWIKRAAAQGHAGAQYAAGLLSQPGNGRAPSLVHAVAWYRKAADQGDADAQLQLGLSLYRGEGVMANRAEAVMWFRRAAEQGHAEAQFILGMCYQKADGVEGNKTEAVAWYRRAAAQDHAEAQVNLGLSYWTGEGVAASSSQALSWFEAVMRDNQKHLDAIFNYMYCLQSGYPKDFSSAAKLGHPGSQYQHGLATNVALWMYKAAKQGHPLAQLALGRMYLAGRGVEGGADLAKAKDWFRRAAKQGNTKAKAKLVELLAEVPPS